MATAVQSKGSFEETTYIGNKLAAITASDSTILSPCFVYVGVGGDVAVVAEGDATGPAGVNAITLKNVPSGTLLPIRVTQVMSTNTTALSLVSVR